MVINYNHHLPAYKPLPHFPLFIYIYIACTTGGYMPVSTIFHFENFSDRRTNTAFSFRTFRHQKFHYCVIPPPSLSPCLSLILILSFPPPIALASTDDVVHPLLFACETKNPVIVKIALSSLQKLIQYNVIPQVLVGVCHQTLISVGVFSNQSLCGCCTLWFGE